jgi:CheY-like chemotaxis protein
MLHLKQVPFIIVTAELGEDVRAAAMQASASFFMTKPAKEGDIKAVLNTFLSP